MGRRAAGAVGFFLLAITVFAQKTGTIEGRVYQQGDLEPLLGANVEIGDNRSVTDDQGFFKVILDPGVYAVKVSFVGYETKVLTEVEVIGGRASLIEVPMATSVLDLPALEVVDKVPTVNPGRRAITQEQINRLAATYYDPARLVASSPDVAVTNDQNNSISVRGIPATYNRWRLEGAEIINPNHLTNAGTLTDQPAGTGGGVNALSAQMLSRSQFLYGSITPAYGNAVAGLFDLRMDAGDTTGIDYFAQASFIGFDFGAGGPIGKKGVSFRANYRYSFTGLLTTMGVDFGGEEIGFQDLSAAVNVPLKSGSLKFFAVGGMSSNDFSHEPFGDREEAKDGSDIFYDGALGISGVSYSGKVFGGARLLTTLAYSISDQSREETIFDLDENLSGANQSDAELQIVSNHTNLGFADLNIGWDLNYYDFSSIFLGQPVSGERPPWRVGSYWMFRPFVTYSAQLSDRLEFIPTVSVYLSDEYETRFEPRAALSYRIYPGTIRLTSGAFTHQQGPLSVVDTDDRFSLTLDPTFPSTTAWKSTLSFDGFAENLKSDYYLELFFYDFKEIVFDQLRPDVLIPPGDYNVWGVTSLWERNFDNNFYASTGITAFFWEGIDNDQLNYHAAGGVRKALNNERKRRNLNLNLRLTASDALAEQGYQFDYFRVDFRFQWVRFRPKLTESWALDIQNLLNTQNQFSVDLNGDPTYQLGFLPILAYRLDF